MSDILYILFTASLTIATIVKHGRLHRRLRAAEDRARIAEIIIQGLNDQLIRANQEKFNALIDQRQRLAKPDPTQDEHQAFTPLPQAYQPEPRPGDWCDTHGRVHKPWSPTPQFIITQPPSFTQKDMP